MSELDVAALYEAHVDFVWRLLSRMGVPMASIDDALQEVFLVLHRRRTEFRQASSVRTWIAGIAVGVSRDFRRSRSRHEARLGLAERQRPLEPRQPDEVVAAAQSLALVLRLLESLDADQRTVFVLTELEQLSAAEIAEITETNVNTVSSRLRLARKAFNALVVEHRQLEEAS